jgi:ankyrin repeat protein
MNKTTKDLFSNDPEVVLKALKSKHADVNDSERHWDSWNDSFSTSYRPIHVARDPRVIRALVEKGAHVNDRAGDGRTPLLYSIDELMNYHINERNKSLETVRALVAAGAELNAQDVAGKTALHRTVARESWDLTKFLLNSGAEVNLGDKDGLTALHYAVKSHMKANVEMLVMHGADVNAKNKNGNTPLHFSLHNSSVAELLMKSGADASAENNDGKTPIDIARDYGGVALEVVQSMKRHVDLGQQWNRHAQQPSPAPTSRGMERW